MVIQVPLNPWAQDRKLKEIGRYQQVNMIEGMEAYSLALFTRVLGWTATETRVFFDGVRKELQDRSIHLYTKYYFVYGQKDGGEWAHSIFLAHQVWKRNGLYHLVYLSATHSLVNCNCRSFTTSIYSTDILECRSNRVREQNNHGNKSP